MSRRLGLVALGAVGWATAVAAALTRLAQAPCPLCDHEED